MAPFGFPQPQNKGINWAATLPSMAEDEAIRRYAAMQELLSVVEMSERKAEAMERLERALRRPGEGL